MADPPFPVTHRVAVRDTLGPGKSTALGHPSGKAVCDAATEVLRKWRAEFVTQPGRGSRETPRGGLLLFDFAEIDAVDVTFGYEVYELLQVLRDGEFFGYYSYYAVANVSDDVSDNLNAAFELKKIIVPILGESGDLEDSLLGDLGRIGVAMPVLRALHKEGKKGKWVARSTLLGGASDILEGVTLPAEKMRRYLHTDLWDKNALVLEHRLGLGKDRPTMYFAVSALPLTYRPYLSELA